MASIVSYNILQNIHLAEGHTMWFTRAWRARKP